MQERLQVRCWENQTNQKWYCLTGQKCYSLENYHDPEILSLVLQTIWNHRGGSGQPPPQPKRPKWRSTTIIEQSRRYWRRCSGLYPRQEESSPVAACPPKWKKNVIVLYHIYTYSPPSIFFIFLKYANFCNHSQQNELTRSNNCTHFTKCSMIFFIVL